MCQCFDVNLPTIIDADVYNMQNSVTTLLRCSNSVPPSCKKPRLSTGENLITKTVPWMDESYEVQRVNDIDRYQGR